MLYFVSVCLRGGQQEIQKDPSLTQNRDSDNYSTRPKASFNLLASLIEMHSCTMGVQVLATCEALLTDRAHKRPLVRGRVPREHVTLETVVVLELLIAVLAYIRSRGVAAQMPRTKRKTPTCRTSRTS